MCNCMKKGKIIARFVSVLVLVLCSLMSFYVLAGAVKIPDISNSKPIITYTYNSSGKIYAYKDSSLKTKTGGFIDCPNDECEIIDIKGNAVKVRYPVSGGTKTAWFSRESFTYRDLKNDGAKFSFKAKASVNVYRWKGKTTKLGSIARNDTCYLLRGDENSDWLQIIYPASGAYKMGWIKKADYLKILPVAESVKLNKSTVVLNSIGASTTFKATVYPDTAIDKTVKWSSSNTAVATVSSTGVVTAKKNGTAVITATSSNGKKATGEVVVKVTVPVTSVTLNKKSLTLTKQGETSTLTATVQPSNATDKKITWSSSNTAVATVSSAGVVTAKKDGTAVITATSSNSKKATADVKVVFEEKETDIPVKSVTLDKIEVVLTEEGETYSFTANIFPGNATNKKITWSSSNTAVATVSSTGVVTARKNGTAVITAAVSNGKKSTADVIVKIEETEKEVSVSSIKLDKSSVTLTGLNSTAVINATVYPSIATDKTIKWKATDSSVAKIQVSGSKYKFTALKFGTTTYTAVTSNGKSASITVKVVEQKATGITLSKKAVTLNGKGKTATLSASVKPDNTTNKSIKWESSDKNIATVSSAGKVTAVNDGTVNITAKTSNGKTALCKVTVSAVKAKSVELNKANISLSVGDTQTVKASISPSNSTDEVAYTSSDKKIATVSSSGKITAKKAGSCTVTAKTTSGKTDKVKVTVKKDDKKSYISISEINSAAKKYDIDKDSKAYSALLSMNTRYEAKLSDADKDGVVVFVFEGVGSSLSTNKRFGAICVVVKDGKISNINKNSSTIPDRPFDVASNGGDKVPTIKSGIYKFRAHNHPSKSYGDYAALKVLDAKVVRFKSKTNFSEDNKVQSINVHRRSSNDIIKSGTPNSSGCIIVGKSGDGVNDEYGKHIKALGLISTGAKSYKKYTKYITGKIIIDREYAYTYMSKIGYSKSALNKLGVTKLSSELLFPLEGKITKSSNVKTNGFYCDYKTGESVPVYAPADGTVVYKQAYRNRSVKKLSSYGNYIEFISNDDAYKVKCCHLKSFNGVETKIKTSLPYKCSGSDGTIVLATKKVVQGELIGYSGKTGNASGHHLHLEVYKNGKAVDPNDIFTAWNK